MDQCTVAAARTRKGWWQRLLGKEAQAPLAVAAPLQEVRNGPVAASPPTWQSALDIDVLFCRWLFADASSGAHADREAALLGSLVSEKLNGEGASALVPRVPTVVPALLRTLRDPSTSMRELSRHVAQDPTLVAAVLKVANSAHFRTSRPIASIEQALLVLGQDALRQVVARIAFKPILNVNSAGATARAAPLIWQQAERCGLACHVLGPSFGASGFEAFLGALLQNAGIIAAVRLLDRAGAMPSHGCSDHFYAALLAHARRLASDIGRHWTFPDAVIAAVDNQVPMLLQSGASPLAMLLDTSDRLSKARLLFEANLVAADDLALDDETVRSCFERLVEAAED